MQIQVLYATQFKDWKTLMNGFFIQLYFSVSYSICLKAF